MVDLPSWKSLCLLGNKDNFYVRDLQRAARELGMQTDVLSFQDLTASLVRPTNPSQAEKPCNDCSTSTTLHIGASLCKDALTRDSSGQLPAGYCSILVRSMPSGSLEQIIFRMDCLHAWQASGTPVINSPRCLETSIDKWLTLHHLHSAGIPIPPTVACQHRDQALEAFDQLGRDVLVKPLFGGEGRGIIRLQDRELAWRTFSTLEQLGHVLYVQQFLPHLGYDIRALVVGKTVHAIRRYAANGGFLTNISRGGRAEPHSLTEAEHALAVRSAEAVGGQIVGIDLLPACDGSLYVLEVNAVPGWKGLATCLKLDIAKSIVRHSTGNQAPLDSRLGCV